MSVASDQEIVSTRVFDAPRERVFQAFSDPNLLQQWWGPEGFTNSFHEFDLRPGGKWRFTMLGPDDASYPMEKAFIEVAGPERIVLEHLDPTHHFWMTILFNEEAGRTLVTWRMRFEDAAEFERVKDFISVANEQNLDRLAKLLAT